MKLTSNDKVQTIPAGLEKYLGKGKMVLPSAETLRRELQKIPEGKLTTIPIMRESIAHQFGVTTSCPKTSMKILKDKMKEKSSGAYRVLNGKGELIAADIELQAELLKAEGHGIETDKTKSKVANFKNKIHLEIK
jgi:alkylated DNA nucleotide flippase Atl1